MIDHPAKPVSPASERNKQPILEVLKTIISPGDKRLLEVGSGTGQHAVYFAPHFPNLEWVVTDVADRHGGIKLWLEEAGLENVSGPVELEIGKDEMPSGPFDYVYSANVLHIISWEKGQLLFEMLGRSLTEGSEIIFYGPFNFNGQFTSRSNEEFDGWLKSQDPESGIRSFEEVCRLLALQGFGLINDHSMPANNRILHFQKQSLT